MVVGLAGDGAGVVVEHHQHVGGGGQHRGSAATRLGVEGGPGGVLGPGRDHHRRRPGGQSVGQGLRAGAGGVDGHRHRP